MAFYLLTEYISVIYQYIINPEFFLLSLTSNLSINNERIYDIIRKSWLNYSQPEENHIMEDIICNELLMRGCPTVCQEGRTGDELSAQKRFK